MINETKRDKKKSNKMKRGLKCSILDGILTSFACALRFLKQKIDLSSLLYSKNIRGFRHSLSGYVLILIVVVVPVLLFGAKYVLDQRTLSNRQATLGSGDDLVKKCAQKAALEVAKKWNPALTYANQKTAMLRIADEVYNNSPTYVSRLINQAIGQVDVMKEVTKKGGEYDPLKVTKSVELSETTLGKDKKQIAQETKTTDLKRYYYFSSYKTNYAPMAAHHFAIMYEQPNSNLFPPDEDLYQDYAYCCNNVEDPFGERTYWYHYVIWPEVVEKELFYQGSLKEDLKRNYTKREDPDNEVVKIEVEDDKIKVTTDYDVGYAIPAKCNVDIILTVPTNSAALNKDNYDKNTSTQGTPYVQVMDIDDPSTKEPTDEAKSTPIYQITRAYQKFLKDNFFYTRGVNVGVIPYSGKVSLRNKRSNWVRKPDQFYDDDNTNIVGAVLYGTKGENGENLTKIGSFAGGGSDLVAYGLLCRGNTESYSTNNKITKGDLLLSKDDPKTSDSYKFRKMVYNPCYSADANLLSMKCEKTGNKYWMNPYFILEMSSDVKFIYNMLGAFYPYYDDRDVSNFTFIPLTWANNLLQSWSATGKNSAQNTSANSTTLGRLSTPSKIESGRKKALILIVNKPDWFEPGELTYLGFDNDYSETLAVESDLIRFDKGKTSGTKGILRYSGEISADSLKKTGVLNFPRKGLLRIVVDPNGGDGTINFTSGVSESNPSATENVTVKKRSEFFIIPSDTPVIFDMIQIKLISAEITNRPYKVESGKVVYTALTPPKRSVFIDLLNKSSNGKFNYKISEADGTVTPSKHLVYGSDSSGKISDVGIKYQSPTYTQPASSSVASISSLNPNASVNPNNWTMAKKIELSRQYKWRSVCYGDGKFVAVNDGEVGNSDNPKGSYVAAYSEDGGKTWLTSQLPRVAKWNSVCYGKGKFVAVGSYEKGNSSYPVIAYSNNGKDWALANITNENDIRGVKLNTVCFSVGLTRFMAMSDSWFYGYSNDGQNWSFAYDENLLSDISSVCSGFAGENTRFIAVSSIGPHKALNFCEDKEPFSWTRKNSDFPIAAHWESVCYGITTSNVNTFVAVASLGLNNKGPTIAYHRGDGWKSIDDKNLNAQFYSVCFGEISTDGQNFKKGFIAIGNINKETNNLGGAETAYLYYSSDGMKWEAKHEFKFLKKGMHIMPVCYGTVSNGITYKRTFVAMSDEGQIIYSNDGGFTWKTDASIKDPINFKSVCYGDGKFVAVSNNSNYAAYSADGKTWTLVKLKSENWNWQSVCYGDGKFVAVGDKKVIFSSDGMNWEEDTSQVYNDEENKPMADAMYGKWQSICYGKGKFVATSDTGDRLVGTVGNWTVFKWNGANLSSVCYGNGKFVLVANNNSFSWCTDGEDWSNRIIPFQNKDYQSVCYGNGKFVAVGNNTAVYSTDGKSWKHPESTKSAPWRSMCYGNGIFVAISSKYSQGKSYIFYSDGEKNWSSVSEFLEGNWKGICYSGKLGRFVAVGDDGAVAYCDVKVTAKFVAFNRQKTVYSNNGIDWYESETWTSGFWKSVCYGNEMFVAYGIYSADGVNWKRTMKIPTLLGPSVCYGNGKFFAISQEDQNGKSYVSYSDDGENWSSVSVIPQGGWQSVCYGGGKFVAVGTKKAACSTDGTVWTEKTISDKYWKSVCYGKKTFVAVGKNTAAYSTDGETWTEVTGKPISDGNWQSVCYGNGQFVAVGDKKVAYSTDGKTWTEVSKEPVSNGDWKSVCYGNGQFLVIGDDGNSTKIVGRVIYSSDGGKTWKESFLPYSSGWSSVCAVRDEEPEVKPIERGWYFYNNSGDNSTNHHFIFPTNPGDMYFVTNSEEFTYSNGDIHPMANANGFFIDVDKTKVNVNDGAVTKSVGSGLYRWTMPAEKAKGIVLSSNSNAHQFYWSVEGLGKTSLPTLYAGATLPINAALFTGGWQSEDGKWNGVDATAAVKQVTKDACTKLKTEWGDNLRIYLIKYREQDGDYSYLNDCTSRLYSVSNKTGLETTLGNIAKDIKEWAGRTEAKNAN